MGHKSRREKATAAELAAALRTALKMLDSAVAFATDFGTIAESFERQAKLGIAPSREECEQAASQRAQLVAVCAEYERMKTRVG